MKGNTVHKTMFDKFIEDIVKNFDKMEIRSIFADYCEDAGNYEMSECMRWMVSNNIRPYVSENTYNYFNKDKVRPEIGDPESDLPEPLYKELKGGDEIANHKKFKNAIDLEKAFFDAWVEAKKNGWQP